MNHELKLKRISVRGLFVAACIISLTMLLCHGQPRRCRTDGSRVCGPPAGISAGSDSAGQAARIATDASGNVAVVSGPGFYA